MRGEKKCQLGLRAEEAVNVKKCRAARLTYEHLFIYSYVMVRTIRGAAQGLESGATCDGAHDSDVATIERVRERLMGAPSVDRVAMLFRLLGDPTRVRLLDTLTQGERCVCDLAALAGMSESAVSHQLRLLRAARLVRVRREGRMAYYALDDHHVAGLLHDTRKHVEEAGRGR